MAPTRPIPVRLTDAMLERLDTAAEQTGLGNRTAVIRLCLLLFLDALEKQGYHVPSDILGSLREHDGRSHRYKDARQDDVAPVGLRKVAEARAEYKAVKKRGKKEDKSR